MGRIFVRHHRTVALKVLRPEFSAVIGLEPFLGEIELTASVQAGGYRLADLVRLNYYTTDIDACFAHSGAISQRLAASDCLPSGTLLGVTRLARPELLVEIEGTAVR